MAKVLVTGGAGFIGSHLVEALVRLGHDVRVLDVLSRGSLKAIQHLIGDSQFIDGDIRYEAPVHLAMKGIDYVFHMAATNINRSLKYWEESFDVNARGARIVFQSALSHGVKKVIFSSSASVYGNPTKLPMEENDVLAPITPYCVSKLQGEFMLKFLERHGLCYTTLRYFNVYGPRQHVDAYYTSVIINFLKRLRDKQPPVIGGSGSQSMDFVHVRDVVQANLLAMEEGDNGIYNVGTGVSTTIKELAWLVMKLVGKHNLKPTFLPQRQLVTERRASTKLATEELKFTASILLAEGLEELVKDFAENPEAY